MSCGSASEVRAATPEVQALCDAVKAEMLSKAGAGAGEEFTLVGFRTQVVAGTNYFVKVMLEPLAKYSVGTLGYCPDDCAFFRIFEPLPHTGQKVELAGYQLHGPDASKELCYFE